MIVNLQRRMGENFDSKILFWKKSIETNKSTVKFLEEVQEKQIPILQEDDMELDVQNVVSIMECDVRDYSSYHPDILRHASKLITAVQHKQKEMHITEEILREVIHQLRNERLPYFK